MTSSFVLKGRRDAQTLVFFLLAFGTIILLCGLAIDSGLLYLAKARISRAVDGAALVAVGNFNMTPLQVANSMRDFTVVNFSALGSQTTNDPGIPSSPSSTTTSTVTTPAGTTTTITYWYNDPEMGSDAKGFRKFIEVLLTTGSGGQVTSATCNARCPAQTYFIGFASKAFPILNDLNVSSGAVATRNPRLIMIVVDRSASMLQPPDDNGSYGAFGLPQSIVTFLDFFEPGADYVGIVSFSSNARIEMPLTTNFLYAATNNLIDSYSYATNTAPGSGEGWDDTMYGVPGIDPEMESTNGDYETNYATAGVRRLKFGGDTAADEGMRMALECMMSNSGFNNPDVVKYIVLFTDGVWNNARSLLAAPTYTNWVVYNTNAFLTPYRIVTNTAPNLSPNLADTTAPNLAYATSVAFQPSLSPMPYYTNALNDLEFTSANINHHAGDYWVSLDTNGANGNPQLEPLPGSLTTNNSGSGMAGVPQTFTTTPYVGLDSTGLTNVYSTTLNVWVQPGAVDYLWSNGAPISAYLGDYNNPTNTTTLQMVLGESNELVVPGYVVDGCFYDGLDLSYEFDDQACGSSDNFPGYRWDNYNTAFMWPDDQTALPTASDGGNNPFYYDPAVVRTSFMRTLLFRNYANLLTGFYVFRADDPLGPGVEALDSSPTLPSGTQRPLNGLGAYYPSAGFYWPFDLVGVDWDSAFCLTNALYDPDTTGNDASRNLAYSINMLSTNADPEWSGELFYGGTGGTSVTSSNTAVSSIISSASTWQNGAPSWLTALYGDDMISDATSNTTITPNPKVWRPNTFRGTVIGSSNSSTTPASLLSLLQENPSATGGYVVDGTGTSGPAGEIYKNTMCWNGRPTHYYDFSSSTWRQIPTNHQKDVTSLPLGYWKAQEYAWHARAANVTIYTVGYGAQVADPELAVLASMANATNINTFETNSIPTNYISSQPIGVQYYAYSTNDISNDFYQIGTAINAALTQ